MGFLKEFHYSNIGQKKILSYNVLVTFLILGLLLGDLSRLVQYYFFYNAVLRYAAFTGLVGILAGHLLGKRYYPLEKGYRKIYVFADIVFCLSSLAYLLRGVLPLGDTDPLLVMFFFSPWIILPWILTVSFSAGLKLHYFLKIYCGSFIDDNQRLNHFFIFSFAGFLSGCVLALLKYYLQLSDPWFSILPIFLLPAVFFINLPYSPPAQYAADTEPSDMAEEAGEKFDRKDNLLFTYLNFVFLTIYLFLICISVEKFYGELFHVKIAFLVVSSLCLLGGMIIGRYLKLAMWHIYLQASLPIVFLISLLVFLSAANSLFSLAGMLIFLPFTAVLGVMLNHTLRNLIFHYNHEERFRIISFALFILPVPVLAGLMSVVFTYFWFFVLVYILAVVNFVLPGIHIVNLNIKEYKKAIYFLIPLLLVPVIIYTHMFSSVRMTSRVYAAKTENYEELKNINYEAVFVKVKATVKMYGRPAFFIQDSTLRNLRRALVPLVLYFNPEKGDSLLFIDSNQKFYRNPVIGFFKNYSCLDSIPQSEIDYNVLPFYGNQKYSPDVNDILFHFYNNKRKHGLIVDIPNLLDQNENFFRFSEEYYMIIKKNLGKSGIFAQLYNVPGCSREVFISALRNRKKIFKYHNVYLFSNVLLVLSSDDPSAFSLGQDSMNRLAGFLKENPALQSIFFSDGHVVTHLLDTGLGSLERFGRTLPRSVVRHWGNQSFNFSRGFLGGYIDDNRKALPLVTQGKDPAFSQTMAQMITSNDAAYSLLKKTELSEAMERYEEETKNLFELKTKGEYTMYLKDYISSMLVYKEEYYYNTALRFEKEKNWTKAKILYDAALSINKNNFDANFRLGVLFLTLQDIDSSNKYFQEALRLKPDNPNVLHQLGVLNFSSGKFKEAVDFLNKSLQNKGESAAVYKYLGLSYEKLQNFEEAENFYAKAALADPNDMDTQLRLEYLRKQKERDSKAVDVTEQKPDIEEEQETEMPLPVNKSAYELRLKSKDSTLPILQNESGEAGPVVNQPR